MKSIKLFDGVTVMIDGETEFVEGPRDLWPLLNMDTPEYEEAQRCIMAELLCYHRIDLSAAYPGHTVMLAVKPTKEEVA